MPRTHSEWQRRLTARLLKQDTGRHFLDSGFAYGRNFERNQLLPDEALTDWTYQLDVQASYWSLTFNVAMHLANGWEFDREHTTRLMAFSRRKERADKYWTDDLNDYIASIGGEIYPNSGFNTCNSENLLSQGIHGVKLDLPDRCGDYYALQIHGGCDLRGGYGEYIIAEATDYAWETANAYLLCKNGHNLYTDDAGSRWYCDDTSATLRQDDIKIKGNKHGQWLSCPYCNCKMTPI
jgi:hypothetical protein